jgi:hypothetical protein
MFKGVALLGFVVLVLVIALCGPFFIIWAWNVLFGAAYAIPYTFETWLAVLLIGTFIRADVKVTKKN